MYAGIHSASKCPVIKLHVEPGEPGTLIVPDDGISDGAAYDEAGSINEDTKYMILSQLVVIKLFILGFIMI